MCRRDETYGISGITGSNRMLGGCSYAIFPPEYEYMSDAASRGPGLKSRECVTLTFGAFAEFTNLTTFKFNHYKYGCVAAKDIQAGCNVVAVVEQIDAYFDTLGTSGGTTTPIDISSATTAEDVRDIVLDFLADTLSDLVTLAESGDDSIKIYPNMHGYGFFVETTEADEALTIEHERIRYNSVPGGLGRNMGLAMPVPECTHSISPLIDFGDYTVRDD